MDEACGGGKKGSFGRRHEVCTPEPPPPPKDDYNYSDYLRNRMHNNEEYVGKWQAPLATRHPPRHSPRTPPPPKSQSSLQAATLGAPGCTPLYSRLQPYVLQAPKECPCSGWKSRLGFGGHCKAWEEKLAPHQTPWCYVAESCALAEKKKGSFGRKHIDCTYEYTDSAGSTPKPLEQGPIRPKAGAGAAKSKALARSKEGGTPGSAGWFSKLFHGRRLQVAGRRTQVAGRSLQQEYPAGVRRVGDAVRTDRKRERQQLKSNEHVAEEVALLGRVARERCAKRRHEGRTCHDCTLYFYLLYSTMADAAERTPVALHPAGVIFTLAVLVAVRTVALLAMAGLSK